VRFTLPLWLAASLKMSALVVLRDELLAVYTPDTRSRAGGRGSLVLRQGRRLVVRICGEDVVER